MLRKCHYYSERASLLCSIAINPKISKINEQTSVVAYTVIRLLRALMKTDKKSTDLNHHFAGCGTWVCKLVRVLSI